LFLLFVKQILVILCYIVIYMITMPAMHGVLKRRCYTYVWGKVNKLVRIQLLCCCVMCKQSSHGISITTQLFGERERERVRQRERASERQRERERERERETTFLCGGSR